MIYFMRYYWVYFNFYVRNIIFDFRIGIYLYWIKDDEFGVFVLYFILGFDWLLFEGWCLLLLKFKCLLIKLVSF